MKVGIMQPYFFPYIGYFQLLNFVDAFVVYDEIKYTKQSWINRNRFLLNNQPHFFTIGLRKDSDFSNISERFLSNQYLKKDHKKIIAQLQNTYQKAPFFDEIFPLIQDCFTFDADNLFDYILYSLHRICGYLEIQTPLIVSSDLDADANLKKEQRVISIAKELKGTRYINPIGGLDLYHPHDFSKEDIQLYFLKTKEIIYPQFQEPFHPYLSIIDVLFFNDKTIVQDYLTQFSLICRHPKT